MEMAVLSRTEVINVKRFDSLQFWDSTSHTRMWLGSKYTRYMIATLSLLTLVRYTCVPAPHIDDTTEVPSWNRVRNTRLALVNMPSFKETTIN